MLLENGLEFEVFSREDGFRRWEGATVSPAVALQGSGKTHITCDK
jgi:hypothetical protein